MSIFEKSRFKIFSPTQHPYSHPVSDFFYSNPALPGASSLEDTLNILTAAIWPNYKGTVATPANLPGVGTINDYYVVTDDGDGKSAGYVWQRIDSVEQWIKRYDWDWSSDNLLASAINSVAPYYVHKWGRTDTDETGNAYSGDLAGQRIYGGDAINQHLILYANSGDLVGNTGFVQFGDNVRPLLHNTFTLGSNTYRFSNFFTLLCQVGTLSFSDGSITDSSGSISFSNENLSTTGTFASGTHTIGTMVIASASITNTSGAISFNDENLTTTGNISGAILTGSTSGVFSNITISLSSIVSASGSISFNDENLTTTGTLQAGAATFTSVSCDDLFIDTNSIVVTTLNTNLVLAANGTGIIDVNSDLDTLNQTIIGIVDITGQLDVDNIQINGNTISSTDINGNITISPNGTGKLHSTASFLPNVDNSLDLGTSSNRFRYIYLTNSIQDGTYTFLLADLFALRSTVFRDLARTLPAQTGDTLFYDGVNNVWLASVPDTEITHNQVSGLTTGDAGHTQFALLAGRAGGQSLIGGTAASENLNLESTAHATKGSIFFKDNISPFTNASYSGSWSGTDIGDSSHYIRDVYSKGEFKGFRLENYTYAMIPVSSAANVGRAIYVTDRKKIYVDDGTTFKVAGSGKYSSDQSFDGVVTVKNVDVSAEIVDARTAIIQLLDNNNDFERIFCTLKATSASNVRIETGTPLPAGSYRLIVME